MKMNLTRLSLCAAVAGSLPMWVSPGYAQTSGFPNRPGQTNAGGVDANATPPTNSNPSNSDTQVPAQTDQDFLKSTAGDLGETAPSQRIDQQILNWYGLRPQLESKGLTFAGTLTLDTSKPAFGGADTEATVFRSLLDLRFNVDTRALAGWKGGTFSIDFQNQVGRNGSDHVGDIQGFDNADADGRTQISELWYEQILLDNKLRIKVGKVDANTEFAAPHYASAFLNSSFGYSPTLTGLPTYPDPSASVNVFVYPTRWFYAGIGVYDGGGRDQRTTGDYGPSKLWHSGERFFTIGEMGVQWLLADSTLPGRLAVGGTYLSGQLPTFDGGSQDGAASFYAVAEQKLWHLKYYDKTNERGLYASLQYGHADHNVSPVTDHLGAALSWLGPYEKANLDSLGVGVSAVHVTDEQGPGFTRADETSFEAYYNWQALSYLSVRPDVQYILHPGASRDIPDALVFTVRLVVNF